MNIFDRKRFEGLIDRGEVGQLEGMRFQRCYFEGCGLSITLAPEARTTVRDVQLVDCDQRGCGIECAVFDEVLVDGLKSHDLQLWAAVFRHVTLRGRIGRIMTSPLLAMGQASPAQLRAFDDANAKFYAGVDWALDLSEAEFEECDLRGVPATLVRRDPLSQVVVTREAALTGRWRDVDLSKTYWRSALDGFLEDQAKDIVLIAPKRAKNYAVLLEGLQRLRECGVAKPD
jgi:uncharacterized protein YjbI with pentapeptide repeats